MKTDTTHESAVTQFIAAHGIRYAFRRIGGSTDTPIVFCHRFRGTMDDWDPAVINGFAKDRPVVLRCPVSRPPWSSQRRAQYSR